MTRASFRGQPGAQKERANGRRGGGSPRAVRGLVGPGAAGLSSPGGAAGLTAARGDDGGLSLYLERDVQGALLHVEVSDDDVRKLYEFLRAHFGERPRPGARKRPEK